MTDPLLWIWLSLACSPGSDAWGLLRDAGQTPLSLYAATLGDLADLPPHLLRRRTLLARLSDKSTEAARAILRRCSGLGVEIVGYDAPAYPPALRELRDPPAVLYVRGRLPGADVPAAALIGTRAPTAYGAGMAFTAARDLACAGVTVASGMALGVDACSHAGALYAHGRTVAFVASGPDVIYPASHRRLADAIIRDGAVVGEYPPGTPAERFRFPARNRLVSAYARAAVLFEGQSDSGSLITARIAMKLRRPTYALPGRLDDPHGEASAILFSEGARPFLSASALLRDLSLPAPAPAPAPDASAMAACLSSLGVSLACGRAPRPEGKHPSAPARPDRPAPASDARPAASVDPASLSPEAAAVWALIPPEGVCHTDALAEASDAPTVLCGLTLLEASGLIRRLPGGFVCRADDPSITD